MLFNISKQALNPGPNFGSYGIAKAALLALMKQYALEAAGSKIRSNGINADRIKSGLLDENSSKKEQNQEGFRRSIYAWKSFKAEVKPKDVSNAFISLALMEKLRELS